MKITSLQWSLLLATLLLPTSSHCQEQPVDFDKARQIFERREHGETITAEEEAYVKHAMAERRRQQGGEASAQTPATAGAGDIDKEELRDKKTKGAAKGAKGIAGEFDMEKAKAIFQRRQSGEKISAEDEAYLQKAMSARRGGAKGVPAAPQPTWSDHLTPLTELAEAKYKGEDGGLYGGGRNEPPKEHLAAALAEAAKIQPLDAEGKPSKDGQIVLLSIGMSNTTMEYSVFKTLADADPQKSASVVVVDGAKGARTGTAWALDGLDLLPTGEEDRLLKIMAGMGRKVTKGFGDTWTTVEERLQTAGVNARQVQAVWIKQAEAQPAKLGEFPDHARALQANITDILTIARHRYPNLRIAYLSSRIYGGYATTPLNPEPYAYEEAFSMRWLIQEQIAGKPALNYDPARGEVKAPLVLWGPYLWADGTTPRKADGLVYTREDLSPGDGTHPEQSARTKVANLLLTFLKNDPTARRWFTGKSSDVGAR